MPHNEYKQESFAYTRDTTTHDSLDDALDDARSNSKDIFSFADLVRGRSQPKKRRKTGDLKPIVYVNFNSRMGKAKPVVLKALLDSGGSASLVCEKHAQKLRMKTHAAKTSWTTPGGALRTTKKCQATFIIPELHDNKVISYDLHVAKNLGSYDMIIGRDVMEDLGIDLHFSSQEISWEGSRIPFKDIDSTMEEAFHIDDPVEVDDAAERLIKKILDAKYDKANLQQVCSDQAQLNEDEQEQLFRLMQKHEELFDGTLGSWNLEPYDVELKEDAKPYHARAYPIPQRHVQTLKTEVYRLCEIGVLKEINRSEWAAPSFIIPKKDGSVRFISDFRELNKRIKRKPYPIPKIQDLLLKLEGFKYATSLDLNMGYYHIELSARTKQMCTIVFPFGKFEYQRLPMGLCNSPDIFQEKMSDLMRDLEFVRAYLDDLLVITKGSYEDHLQKLDEVLGRLKAAGLKVNCNKSFFARSELEYLGYWITRDGIQPVAKKVEAIQRIAEPKNRCELCRFIGVVNYYRDMWVRRSHTLAPLARLTSKTVKWQWTDVERQAFRDMKRIIAQQVLLAYPDFSKKFVIHTDASGRQLGAVISQDGKPIAFYSRKLKDAQTRYTTTERELLSIVETLKEFRNILLGQDLEIHTDHKNLTCKNFNTDRVMRWRLILEEYGPELKYVRGENNEIADALSRLDMYENTSSPSKESFSIYKEAMAELYAEDHDGSPSDAYPLTYDKIHEEQQKDRALQGAASKSRFYATKPFKHSDTTYHLLTWKDKIVLPKSMQKVAATWYHDFLMHPGSTRLQATMGQHYHWKGIEKTIRKSCETCPLCQLTKRKNSKFAFLPP